MVKICSRTIVSTAILAAAAAALGGAGSRTAAAPASAPLGELASHRAVYELKLDQTRGKSGSVVAARGRILYDFTGSACEGYTLEFRQVTELNSDDDVKLSDLRANSWEDGAAKSYRFNSQDFRNQRLSGAVDGHAERQTGDDIAVTLTKPGDKKFSLGAATVFPTEHVRRIIEAARENKRILEFPIYDGSDTGEKVFNTLTVIGREIGPNERVPTDAAAGKPELAGLKRWPVTVSYFERGNSVGEQLPVYSISFELYENGISRALVLAFSEISIRGELTSLDIRPTKPCP
jgi:hypothetical protein